MLLCLQPSEEQAQTALEPGQGAGSQFFKGPMIRIGLFLRFFQRARLSAGVFLPSADAPVEGERHDQEQAIRGAQWSGFQAELSLTYLFSVIPVKAGIHSVQRVTGFSQTRE